MSAASPHLELPLFELKNASVILDAEGARGFKDVSLNITKGEFVVLLGRSGSGKSTLLKTLAGLIPLTTGTIVNLEKPSISFVFQDPSLLPWKTVEENVALPFRIGRSRRISAGSIEEKVTHVLDLMGLEDARSLYPAELSGGMKMRTSLARAWVSEPELLLLDEPFAALDEPLRMELGELLVSMWKERKCTIVMVTHSITEALLLSNRIIMLKGQPGKIILDDQNTIATHNESSRNHPRFNQELARYFELLRGEPGV